MRSTEHSPLRILLADDDKDDRFFFKRALTKINVETELISVTNGERLMDYLVKHSDDLPYLLFLDLNMPRKNGNECLNAIKSNAKFRSLPVVIYSTSLRDEVADVLFNNGAHYYLHKCNYVELVKSLQKIFNMMSKDKNRPTRDKFILNLQDVN